MKGEQPFVPQTAELLREGAAVDREIVGELLAIEGDGKTGAAHFAGAGGEIEEQLLPGGALGEAEDLLGEGDVFLREDERQVEKKPTVGETDVYKRQARGYTI